MKSMHLILFTAFVYGLVPGSSVRAAAPNIVFILADDMSFDSVSANNDKIGAMRTPRIDGLIAGGMNFTDAHSGSAVCTPTRYGLLTGRYCWRTKLKRSVLWEWAAPLIEDERLTVAELLQEQGYTTGMVGKWHLGMTWFDADGQIANAGLKLEDAGFRAASKKRIEAVSAKIDFSKPVRGGPLDHGFDFYFGVDVPNFPPYAWIKHDQVQGDPSVPKPKEMFGLPGPMVPGWKLENILAGLGNEAASWIAAQAKTEEPFFLYVPLTSPHAPISPSKAFQGKSGISTYADFVIETDAVVGQVLDALERSGAAKDTLVFFSCDNGTSPSFANFTQLEKQGVNLRNHFKGHKAQIHEGGHRVPFAARWPGNIKPGSTCNQTICLNDFMATVAELLNVELPENTAEDSTSILPLLMGTQSTFPDRPAVVHHDIGGIFAIRQGPWKLVAGKKPRLFNLDDDPKEANDLAAAHPERVQNMRSLLESIQKSGE
jgi:arylsulfatase A-like enzyme